MRLLIKHINKTAALAALALMLVGSFAPLLSPSVARAVEVDLADQKNISTIDTFITGGRATPTGAAAGTDTPPTDDFGCSLNAFSHEGKDGKTGSGLAMCVTGFIYVIGPGLAGYVANLAAYFFDIMASLSLNSIAYSLDFLGNGWTVARDLANMAFIFILIYIALVIMLEADTANTMRMLATLVVMALLVNFSFFLTRVVIDAGNILAVQFYNGITVDTLQSQITPATGASPQANGIPSNTREITKPIMNALNVQSLYGQESFKRWVTEGNDNRPSAMTIVITLSFLYISVAVVFWILTFAFFQIGITFVLRTVGLWFVIMAAPLAFAAKVLSKNGSAQTMYKTWQTGLIKFSFCPAIFLLIYLIIVKVVNGISGVDSTGTSTGIVGSIFNPLVLSQTTGGFSTGLVLSVTNVAVRMGIIIVMLYYGLKGAEMLCEQNSAFMGNIAGKLGGVAARGAGLATRATASTGAWAGRNTVGRSANALARSQTLQNWSSRSSLGLGVKKMFEKTASSSMDVRNAPGGGLLNKASSKILGSSINTGTAGGKGGFTAKAEERKKAIVARAKSMLGDTIDEKKAQKKFQEEYDSKHGAGSFDARVEGLAKTISEKQKTALALDQVAVGVNDEPLANEYRKQAAAAREDAKKAQTQLKPLTEVGEKTVKAQNKERITAFAHRLSTPNISNIGMPSRGSILGAKDIMKLVKEQSTKDKALKAVKDWANDEEGGNPDPDKPTGGAGGGSSSGGGTSASGSGTSSSTSGGAHAQGTDGPHSSTDNAHVEKMERIEHEKVRLLKELVKNHREGNEKTSAIGEALRSIHSGSSTQAINASANKVNYVETPRAITHPQEKASVTNINAARKGPAPQHDTSHNTNPPANDSHFSDDQKAA